jgi:hypothetical protein
MVAGSLARLSYAAGLLLAPRSMSRFRLIGPDPPDPYARMTTRAFEALHTHLALQTIRSAVLDRDVRFVLTLNIGSDVADFLGPTLEWRRGDLPALAALGNAALQSLLIINWSVIIRGRRAASFRRSPLDA